jgi:hypothetical protein
MSRLASLLVLVMLFSIPLARAIDADQFDELEGYTVIACTHAAGELEGADFDKLVKLDNGMIFEFQTYSYFYDYRPAVVVFGRTLQYQGKSLTLYKLLIGDEDEIFDVIRVR